MTKDEIANGYEYHDALAEMLGEASRGTAGPQSMLEVKRLCSEGLVAIDDNCCREQLDLIELYARDYFSQSSAAPWRQSAVGNDVLRSKITKCLATLHARLIALQSVDFCLSESQRGATIATD